MGNLAWLCRRVLDGVVIRVGAAVHSLVIDIHDTYAWEAAAHRYDHRSHALLPHLITTVARLALPDTSPPESRLVMLRS